MDGGSTGCKQNFGNEPSELWEGTSLCISIVSVSAASAIHTSREMWEINSMPKTNMDPPTLDHFKIRHRHEELLSETAISKRRRMRQRPGPGGRNADSDLQQRLWGLSVHGDRSPAGGPDLRAHSPCVLCWQSPRQRCLRQSPLGSICFTLLSDTFQAF